MAKRTDFSATDGPAASPAPAPREHAIIGPQVRELMDNYGRETARDLGWDEEAIARLEQHLQGIFEREGSNAPTARGLNTDAAENEARNRPLSGPGAEERRTQNERNAADVRVVTNGKLFE